MTETRHLKFSERLQHPLNKPDWTVQDGYEIAPVGGDTHILINPTAQGANWLILFVGNDEKIEIHATGKSASVDEAKETAFETIAEWQYEAES